MFPDVRVYFLGAILQSQSLIGRTKFPASAAASLRSKISSALTRSDTFVGESCLFFAHAIRILKTEIFYSTYNQLSFPFFLYIIVHLIIFIDIGKFQINFQETFKKPELFNELNCKST